MRFCGYPGCRVQVEHGKCPEHTRPAWGSEQGKPKRQTGEKLQVWRSRLWVKDPRCQACWRLLHLKDAIRDHIVNLKAGGEDTEENSQILCRPCHQEKTSRESVRGRTYVRL